MANPSAKLSPDGQLQIPAEIQEKLGGPGALVEFIAEGDQIILRRGKSYTFAEIREILFPTPPRARTVEEMDDAIGEHLRRKHARR